MEHKEVEKYIVMNRGDGTGSRIYSLMNTLFIAEKLGNINYAKFLWNETRFFQGDKPDGNNTNMRNFENNTIIGASCESKESIFSADFIAKFYLPQIPNNPPQLTYPIHSAKSFEDLKAIFDSNLYNFLLMEIPNLDVCLKIDSQEYRQGMAKAFKKIDFAPAISGIINKARSISKDLGDFDIIHLRAGDNLGFWAGYRRVNRQSMYHGTYFELALAIIEKESTDKKFLIVSDDLTSANELVRVINRKNVFCVDGLRDSSMMSNLELFFFDIILMSYAKNLYGTHSALVRIAQNINPSLTFHLSYQVFTKEEQYKILLANYLRLKNLYPALRAFSCAHKFYLAEALKLDVDTQISYCNEALNFDFENDKYRIYKIDCLLKKDINLAEAYIKEILESRSKEFLAILLCKYWSGSLAYGEFFNAYYTNASPKYPYISYLAFKTAKIQEKMIESIVYMNNALQANDNFLNELLKPDLTFKEQDINHLALQINILNMYSAKARIQNHLSYKLGQIIIRNSKSLFGLFKLPYLLIAMTLVHKEQEKAYKEKIKTNPKLALPALESYLDYKEALKEKECFTYKLGLAFIKGFKSWYKGGFIQFFFEAKALEREFKSKKAKQE